jgi:hypothetical protein
MHAKVCIKLNRILASKVCLGDIKTVWDDKNEYTMFGSCRCSKYKQEFRYKKALYTLVDKYNLLCKSCGSEDDNQIKQFYTCDKCITYLNDNNINSIQCDYVYNEYTDSIH